MVLRRAVRRDFTDGQRLLPARTETPGPERRSRADRLSVPRYGSELRLTGKSKYVSG